MTIGKGTKENPFLIAREQVDLLEKEIAHVEKIYLNHKTPEAFVKCTLRVLSQWPWFYDGCYIRKI